MDPKTRRLQNLWQHAVCKAAAEAFRRASKQTSCEVLPLLKERIWNFSQEKAT